MKNTHKTLCCIIVAFLSCNIAADPISNKKLALQQVNQQIQQVEKNIKLQSIQRNALQNQLKTLELALGELNHQISHMNELQNTEQEQLFQLNLQQKNTQKQLSKQRELLSKHIRAAYFLGQANEVKILFNQENPHTLNRHLNYYRYLSQDRLELINKIKLTLTQLNHTLSEINQHQNNLENLLTQKKQQLNKALTAQKNRHALLTTLAQSVETKQQQLVTLMANQNALQTMINQMQAQTVDILSHQPFTALQGKLHWPVKGILAAKFGSPLDVETQHLSGVIIKAPLGAPVFAIASGKVMFANWLRGFGLLIILNHGNGFMSLYARNQSLEVKIGDSIKAGEPIATVGNSGGYASSSLYFEIRQNGIPINPSNWCRYT